jgi:hypothetical protein
MRPRQTDRKEHKGNHKTIFLKQCRMIKITKKNEKKKRIPNRINT